MIDQIGFSLQLLVGFGAIWVLFHFGFRPLLVDEFRQRLFRQRDELFLFAADGGVAFDAAAYRALRDRINALIRFAQRVSLIRFIFLLIGVRRYGSADKSRAVWESQLKALPRSAQERLGEIDNRLAVEVLRQLVWSSPPLVFLAIFLEGWKFVTALWSEQSRVEAARKWRVDVIEEQASREFKLGLTAA